LHIQLPQHSVLIRFFEAPQSPQRGLSFESAEALFFVDRFLVAAATVEAAFFFAILKNPCTFHAEEIEFASPTIRISAVRILAHLELDSTWQDVPHACERFCCLAHLPLHRASRRVPIRDSREVERTEMSMIESAALTKANGG
jgi:hypothetical protein